MARRRILGSTTQISPSIGTQRRAVFHFAETWRSMSRKKAAMSARSIEEEVHVQAHSRTNRRFRIIESYRYARNLVRQGSGG
jgi:predicted metalloendopeptidase